MGKRKLTVKEQVRHMRDVNGVKFTIVNESQAEAFLTNNTYYFKIKSYAKNYEKYSMTENKNKYINLEFAYLQELSTLDMHLRKFIIKITLDIEHFLKTKLLRDISDNEDEDGYTIVEKYLHEYDHVNLNIQEKADSYCFDLSSSYKGKYAVWNIVELLSFGDFIWLYIMYYDLYPSEDNLKNCLFPVKSLRNAAAHNNCLLNSLRKPYSKEIKKNKKVNLFVSRIPGISPEERKNKMSNPFIHDFIVTLYVFNSVVSSKR